MNCTSFKAQSGNTKNWLRLNQNPLLFIISALQAFLFCGNAYAFDAPEEIRIEQNVLVWEEVAGVSTYDVYLLSSVDLNANGTYLDTVVNSNEFTLNTAGIYTVVSVTPDGEYSALHSSDRVIFDNSVNVGGIEAPENIRLERNQLVWDDVAGVSTYDIYLLSSVGLNANGTYLDTVVDANEYALSTAGIYTVVSVTANRDYSALHSGNRVIYENSINIGAIDAPSNIRLEENLLVWDDVAGVSTYDIYLLSSVSPNANGTYLETVVNANEYALSTAGIYTVVSVASDREYSALHSGGRVEFPTSIILTNAQ